MTTVQLVIYFLSVNLGIGLHLLKKLHEFEVSGTLISPSKYLKDRPYGTALMVLSAWAMCGIWILMGAILTAGIRPNDYALAFLTGVGANSAFDALRARAEAKFRV